ncbi:MAG: restriction endonuclease subunit S [Cyanobacteriota bacterium]|nr:restriction endonuclease subunit S [Cyanobacteriota bacterium]
MPNFPKYESYKDNGIEWLGEIPQHWKIQSLNSILVNRNEKNDPVKTKNILSLSIANGVTPYSDENRGGNKANSDLTAYKLAYPGDIVLNSMNVVVGAVGLSEYFGAISPVYYALNLRIKEKNDIRFFDYIFKNSSFQRYLFQYGKGILFHKSDSGKLNTIRMKISIQDLKKVPLPLPPLEEQNRIVEFLDRTTAEIDRAIAQKQRLIELLQEQKAILINQAVTKELNPNVPMRDRSIEWIGEIPEHWDVKRLRYIGSCQNGISQSADYFGFGYPFVTYTDVYANLELPKIVSGLANSTNQDRRKYSVQRGDVFFTRTSETVEEIGISSTCFNTIKDATFSGFLIRFRPVPDLIVPEFSKYYFRCQLHRFFFVKEMTLVTRASLSQELLKKLPVLLPPIEEQTAISNDIQIKEKLIDDVIFTVNQQIEKLKEYKQLLIANAITGKIKV